MPYTIKQWKSNTKLQTQLKEALDNPALKSALETLTVAYLPAESPSLTFDGETKDLTVVLALRHMHRVGFYGFINALQNLARPIEEQQQEAPGWGKLHPESE